MSYSLSYTKKNLKKLSFLIYGLGSTGNSVINYFEKRKIWNYVTWDDNAKLRKKFRSKITTNLQAKLENVDYVVLSPGISLKKTKYKKDLTKFKKKIITDLDLLYICNSKTKTIVITGTNGKSTICKILEHVLKKNKINVKLGGNIGKPILNLNFKNNPLLIIEASSFQLAYSQFIRPNQAVILNISKDHLDWHITFKNYINSKFKIFSNQRNKDSAFLNNKLLIKKFIKERYKSKLNFVKLKEYLNIKKKIQNNYLKLHVDDENMSFIYNLSKKLKIKKNSIIKSLKTFKGLAHRQEIFYERKNIVCVNDSKATSFESTKFALENKKDVFLIIGGLPKKGDKLILGNLKKNINKAYIIGKHMSFFKKQLKNKVKLQLCGNLEKAIIAVFKDIIKANLDKKTTVLFSPASASYDQYKNFETRGIEFKKLCKFYAQRYI